MPEKELPTATEDQVLLSITKASEKLRQYTSENGYPQPKPGRKLELLEVLESNKSAIFGAIKAVVDTNFFTKRIQLIGLHPALREFFKDSGWERSVTDALREWFWDCFGNHIRVEGDSTMGTAGYYLELA